MSATPRAPPAVKMLRVNGAGTITVTGNVITSAHGFEASETETSVDVFCPGGSSISWGGGSISGNVLGHGSSICGGGYTIHNCSVGNVGSIINGQIIMGGGSETRVPDAAKPLVKRFAGNCSAFDDIDVTGAVRVECFDPSHLVGVTIQGSGDVVVHPDERPYVDGVHATVLGSGDISFCGMIMPSGVFTVTGSGDIHGAYCTGPVTATVTGSGDISCTVEGDARVRKRVTGSGGINIVNTRR
jgi:hypothetical protein